MAAKLRLAELLLQCKQSEGWLALSNCIKEICDVHIDPERLKKIAEGHASQITLREIEALDQFLLRRFKKGLGEMPFLVRYDDLVHSVLDTARVIIYLGARRAEKQIGRDYVDIWDVRSCAEIVKGIQRRNRDLEIKIEQIVSNEPAYLQELLPIEGTAIAAGSPRSNAMTSYLLEQAFPARTRAEPVQRVHDEADDREFPFRFCWSPKPAASSQSRFAMSANALLDPKLEQRVQNGTSSVMLIDSTPFEANWTKFPGDDYGLIVAQRRSSTLTWLATLGLSGPGTLAASTLLVQDRRIRAELPQPDRNRAGRAIYFPVHVSVDGCKHEGARGDPREVKEARLLAEHPRIWKWT